MAQTGIKPTDKQRRLVEALSSFGFRQMDIATDVALRSPKTLRKHCREELERGRIGADVGKTLYTMAASGKRTSATLSCLNSHRRARLAPGTNPVVAPDLVGTRDKEAA